MFIRVLVGVYGAETYNYHVPNMYLNIYLPF